LNCHSLSGAFTAPWARQCPAYPFAWLQGCDLNARFVGMSHVRGLITAPITLRCNWRKREVLILNGMAIHLASNERRTPARLRFLKIGGRLSARCSYAARRTSRIPGDADTPVG